GVARAMGDPRQPGANSGTGGAALGAQAARRDPGRQPRSSARTSAAADVGRGARSDCGDHRRRQHVSDRRQRSISGAMTTPEQPKPADTNASRKGAQPWHRRLAQGLLYGRGVDRAKKARARLGLALLVFSLVYLIIGGRLVLYAVAPESHVARRAINTDAVATARPDIQDRNGEVLAPDVVTPSLFAAPRRIIDADEASELLTAVMPDLAGTDLRERLASKRGFVWLKREISAKQQLEVHKLGVPGLGFLNETKRVYPKGAEASHIIGHVNIDNQGIAWLEK